MTRSIAKVVDIDGKFRESPDFPVAVVREPSETDGGPTGEGAVIDPIFNSSVTRNLYGRMMTLVEATTDSYKLKAVKDIFSKELRDWENDVYRSARDLASLADGKNGPFLIDNIYTK